MWNVLQTHSRVRIQLLQKMQQLRMRVVKLNRNKRLIGKDNQPIINDIDLAALTLLVAESLPKSKEMMVKLIVNMLAL